MKTRWFRSAAPIVIVAGAIATSMCAGSSPSAPSSPELQPGATAAATTASGRVGAYAAGDTTNSTPAVGQLKVCKSAGSNVSGTFNVTASSVGGGSATVSSPITVAAGSCRVVAEDFDGAPNGSNITVTETSAGFQSVTGQRIDNGVVSTQPGVSNGGTLFLNSFHGYALTFVNNVAPPPPPPPPPPPAALFVIGDVEPHTIDDIVNFWGAQWWKNNSMSGFVSNGVASFKGFASESDNVCGGTWSSRPGNSSNPPATIPDIVTIIVTDTVVKNGPNISGNIKELVTVRSDGGYGPAPGKRGNGPVVTVVCR